MAIPWSQIEQAGFRAGVGAIGRGLQRIEARSKELAPVRKVFGQHQKPYKTRLKTVREIRADRGLRQQLGLGPEDPYINPPLTVARRAPQNLGSRTLSPATNKFTGRAQRQVLAPRAQDRLDRRGRYEHKTLRAQHGDQLGGRLRSEIYSTEVKVETKLISGKVISPTPYAKYQEFGTRHNPAHPYLRPAGHESRESIRRDVGRSVVAAARPLFRGRLDVVIKTRAR